MDHHEKHHIAHIEKQIKNLGAELTDAADGSSFEELLNIIHKPGWTTPAESLLVSGIIDTMREHTKVLASLKQVLMNGSRAVGTKQGQVELNPQPLPPER